MATSDKQLADPPAEGRARQLWLQHGAGLILFEDVRQYALEQIDASLPEGARAAAARAVDDTVYGLMMVIDGVTGSIQGGGRVLSLRTLVRLEHVDTGQVIEELDLFEGDGMSIGYHAWLEGDFGDAPVVR